MDLDLDLELEAARKRMLPKWRVYALNALLALCAISEIAGWPSRQEGIQHADLGLSLLLYVALFALSQFLMPKPKIENARPAGLGDFNVPTATEGRVVPIVWGDVMLSGPNVVWYGDLRQKAITKSVKTNMFSSKRVTVGFKYYIGIQFALCEGTVDELSEIYVGDNLVFDTPQTADGEFFINKPNLFGGNDLGSGGLKGTVSFHQGAPAQAPDAYLSGNAAVTASVVDFGIGDSPDHKSNEVLTVVGGTGDPAILLVDQVAFGGVLTARVIAGGNYSVKPNNPVATTRPSGGSTATFNLNYGNAKQDAGSGTNRSPRYANTCYCVLHRGYVGNSTSIKPWKFRVKRVPNGLGLITAKAFYSGGVNPANFFYELITNTDWGWGIPAAEVDVVDFAAVADILYAEGNAFGFVLDRPMESDELRKEVERQIDGYLYLDPRDGKYRIKLARADYDVDLVPEITNGRIEEFSRGSWDDTVNQVRVSFHDRDQQFTERTAVAYNLGNALLQGGGTVTSGRNVPITVSYPGVKDGTLATKIAWREMRVMSSPLAKATVIVDQSFWDTTPLDVVTLTDARLGLDKLPMRVARVDLGNLAKGEIKLDLVEDVFRYSTSGFGAPQPSLWTTPTDDLEPFASEQVFEAPRAFLTRDPGFTGAYDDRIWCGAAQQGPEVGFKINARISPAAYEEVGDVQQLAFRGLLAADLNRGASTGGSFSVTMASSADRDELLDEFGSTTPTEAGVDLVNLLLVDGEFMLVTGITSGSGTNVDLTGVYRGVLDSVQADHTAVSSVWFLRGALVDFGLTRDAIYDIKLLPYSRTDELVLADATAIPIDLEDRFRRPYPPGQLKFNTIADDTTNVSLEGTGSGDSLGILLGITRRDHRTTDEVEAVTVDAATLFADFPSAFTYEHEVEVRDDPAGANTLLFTTAWASSASMTLLRNQILQATDGVLPTTLGVVIRSRHTYETEVLESFYDKPWAFTVATGLTGQFNFTALDTNDVSNLYTATQNGTYNFTLSTAIPTGVVEYRLNAGAWLPLIATSGTTGSIVGVVATDTIEIRHSSSTGGYLTHLSMDAPSTGQDAYAILYV